MDVLIFYGLATLIAIFVVAGALADKMLLAFAGLVVILLGLAIATTPITEDRVSSYFQANANGTVNTSVYENLSSNFGITAGTQFAVRPYPVVPSYSRNFTYSTYTLMNQSWQYGLITSGIGAALAILPFI